MSVVRATWLVVGVGVVGCGFRGSSIDDGGLIDVSTELTEPPDAPFDAPPIGVPCYGKGLTAICLATPPPSNIVLDSTSIDTGSDPRCMPSVAPYCTIAADNLMVANTVLAHGPRPLVLVGINRVDIDGTIDASSKLGGQTGAGANVSQCAAPSAATNGGKGGGGAGGSFGGRGGFGGSGNQGSAAGSTPRAIVPPFMFVRGGCRGGNGGASASGSGTGGSSGGAIYVISDATITVSGNIFASGAAGMGGPRDAGGGGGGSGGLIGLDAPTITVAGRLVANAGGGGGGGGNATSGSGGDGTTTSSLTRAPGGSGSTGGGVIGGLGTAGTSSTGANGASGNRGGGGGGGGAGLIRLFPSASVSGVVSPSP